MPLFKPVVADIEFVEALKDYMANPALRWKAHECALVYIWWSHSMACQAWMESQYDF
jgi:hypothetical protein